MRSIILRLLPAILSTLILAACAGGQGPRPAATATLIPTLTVPTPTPAPPLALLGGELLGAPGVFGECDHPPEAQMSCRDESARPVLEVNANASTYARWRLQWGEAQTPLTGDETLALRLSVAGSLAPNLYLVERSGARIGVPLSRFGLRAEQPDGSGEIQTVHVPLREVRNTEGATPNFAEVTELQVVFEWADMAGTLALESVRFLPVWEEAVSLPEEAHTLAAALTMPAGFTAMPVAADLREITQIEFTPEGEMLVSLQGGRIWWYSDGDGDGVYDRRRLYATGFEELVGLLYDPLEGAVWAGGRGRLARLLDSDGNGAADRRELRIDGLPWGRHQNNGLAWNPDPDPFSGEPAYHWIYFGLGSTGDLDVGGELNATVLRFPRTGQGIDDLEVVSRGNRNAYDLVWAPIPVELDQPDGERVWQLFASENGPDFNDAPDEVNHIEMTLFKNELTAPDLRTQALQRLRSYGYVDRQRQIVHIPIERAFDLYLERQRRGTEGASLTPATRDDAALEETGRL